jgi:DNA polymerase I-like protein with 3'-5' exonuclease and polymerase domains
MEEYGYDPSDDKNARTLLENFGQEKDISFVTNGEGISLATENLLPYREDFGFIPLFLRAKKIERYISCLNKMRQPHLYPQYNILAKTGRVYAHGKPAIQNMPRTGGVRECIIPSPGHAFVVADYAMLELVMFSQALKSQFGCEPELADMINDGIDIHRKVAAMVFDKDEDAVTATERNHAKVLNFGIPGGLGIERLRRKLLHVSTRVEGNGFDSRECGTKSCRRSGDAGHQTHEQWNNRPPTRPPYQHNNRSLGMGMVWESRVKGIIPVF